MNAGPQNRQRRILAILLLIAVIGFLIAAIAWPAYSMNRHYDEMISSMLNQREIYQRVAGQSDQYQAEFRRLESSQTRDKRYLTGANESLATAELQRRIKQLTAGQKGDVLSTQVLQTTEEEGFSRVVIRVRMKSTLEDLVSLLYALESQTPYLFVSNLTIRSRQVARRRLPSTQELDKALQEMDVDFQLAGYMRGEDQ